MSTQSDVDGWSICPDAIQVDSFIGLLVGTAPPLPPPPSGEHIASLHDSTGRYWIAFQVMGGIWVQRSGSYRPPFANEGVFATTDPTDDQPAIVEDAEGAIWLFWVRGGSVLYSTNRDGGATWDTPVTLMTATLPASTTDTQRTVHVAGLSGSGSILGMRKRPGDRWFNDNHTGATIGTSQDPPYTYIDDLGAVIPPSTDSITLSGGPDGSIVLAVRLDGASDLSFFYSFEGRTWTPTP